MTFQSLNCYRRMNVFLLRVDSHVIPLCSTGRRCRLVTAYSFPVAKSLPVRTIWLLKNLKQVLAAPDLNSSHKTSNGIIIIVLNSLCLVLLEQSSDALTTFGHGTRNYIIRHWSCKCKTVTHTFNLWVESLRSRFNCYHQILLSLP